MQGFKTRVRIWHKEHKAMMPSAPLWKCDFFGVDTSEMTLLFSTGMKDKTGTDIYEDDLLKDKLQKPGTVAEGVLQVKYNKYTASFQLHRLCRPHVFDMTAIQTRDGVCEESCGYEVVGNIHQNPELLGE